MRENAGNTTGRPTDGQLLKRVHGGDSTALGLLYIRYSPRVYDLAFQFSGSEEEAADITQRILPRMYFSGCGNVASLLSISVRSRLIFSR